MRELTQQECEAVETLEGFNAYFKTYYSLREDSFHA